MSKIPSLSAVVAAPSYRQSPGYTKASSIAAKEKAKVRHASAGDASRRTPKVISNHDVSPEAIGGLFRKGNATAVDSILIMIECGQRLRDKRLSLEHGAWLLWLKANQKTLGFGELKAQRLMKAAKAYPSLATDLGPAEVIRISRQIWGHTPKPAPQISLKPDPSIVAIVPATAPPEPLLGQAADAAMEKITGELKAEKINSARLDRQVAELTRQIEKLEAENKSLRERIMEGKS